MKYGSPQSELIAMEDAFAKRVKRLLASGDGASIASLFDDAETGGLACRILELVSELRPEENEVQWAARSYLRGCLRYKHAPPEDRTQFVREAMSELQVLLLQGLQ